MNKADKLESTTELFVDPPFVPQDKVDINDGQTVENSDMMNDEPTYGDSVLDEYSE